MDTPSKEFAFRHIGPRPQEVVGMLQAIGIDSLDQLIDETVPSDIRLNRELNLNEGLSEVEYLNRLKGIASENKVFKSYIGTGYSDNHIPHVILRNIFENPSWYTPYTPYQAEIAQGRLEALLNFQTMVVDLTGMEIANASLLDEATAAAEAMMMLHRLHSKAVKGVDANTFLVSDKCFPQTLEVINARAIPLGVTIKVVAPEAMIFDESVFGALVQNPDDQGRAWDLSNLIHKAHEAKAYVAVGTDLMASVLVKPPGEMGADVVYGNSQRFGVPLGYGGPHAAFFATREEFAREAPGRIIGVSKDVHGTQAYRMTLQTREQHIRREKAKSNICTAQALLANIAGMYAVWHGPEGLKHIASRIHSLTGKLAASLKEMGITISHNSTFDTLHLKGIDEDAVKQATEKAGLNLRYYKEGGIGISLDETTTEQDVVDLLNVLAEATGNKAPALSTSTTVDLGSLSRTSSFLSHPVFNTHQSETEMMRYIHSLDKKDLGLDTAMIPLGSCTMKLNAAAEMIPVTWPEFSKIHPFAPVDQAKGYATVINELEEALREITGFHAVSLQPNSGAQGEFTGLMVIRAWHHDRGDTHRDVALIPSSAHGTNPASAVMAGMKVVVVKCDDEGNVDVDDLRAKCEKHKEDLSSLLITYPSTHGVYETGIREICQMVHDHGGLVYMDGANMNAQVGLTNPANIGADVCHLNLHKTFAIPHGGGGPGMGPIAVTKELAPYLPGHSLVSCGGDKAIPAVSATPWGSSNILLISHAYIQMLGKEGLLDATRHAILNANYLKARLDKTFDVLYTNDKERVAHEMIFDLRAFKKSSGVTEEDVAKRLMDYGFHAPTVSWPVVGTMMIEPTESEPLSELDRFVEALKQIREEIREIESGEADKADNVLKNAPHCVMETAGDNWSHVYSRQKAAFPLRWIKANKLWPAVGRIDNPYGDRNLVCSCPALDSYAVAEANS